jgi:hypothetical protein
MATGESNYPFALEIAPWKTLSRWHDDPVDKKTFDLGPKDGRKKFDFFPIQWRVRHRVYNPPFTALNASASAGDPC